jgi:hypothetical protein
MFEYLLMPLSKHVDDGFGAVGRSFHEAADQLRQSNHEASARWMHGHLPINYLYRHAIELYLKSMIIVAHRRLRLPSTDGAYEPIPKIKVVNNFEKIHNVHGIQALYDEMKRIFVTNRDLIAKIAKTDWAKIPEDLETSIATVESVDPGSTVFRYPTSDSPVADKQKSSFKNIETDVLLEKMNSDGPKQFALVMVNDNNEVVESFALDDKPMPELRDALVCAVGILSGAQLGVLMELGKY